MSMSEKGPDPGRGSVPPHDPALDDIEARAAALRALIERTPPTAHYDAAATVVELRLPRRRHVLLAAGGLLIAAGVLLFVLLVTGVSLLGVLLLAPGLLLLALAIGWRPFYSLYLPGFALAGWGAGMIVDKAIGSAFFLSLVGLGAGLVIAWIVRRLQVGWAHAWPLLTGLVLAGLGVLPGLAWSVVWHAWPLVLVAGGVVLVLVAVLPRRGRAGGPPARRF